MALTNPRYRIKQVATKSEATEGTYASPAAADVRYEVGDLTVTTDLQLQERNNLRTTMSRQASVVGLQVGDLSLSNIEAKPGVDETTKPPIARELIALGCSEHTVYAVAVGSVTGGPFHRGEEFSDGSTKSGVYIAIEDGTLYYALLTGDPLTTSDEITGEISEATVTASAASSAVGFGYRPSSVDQDALSAIVNLGRESGGECLKYVLRGLRGDGSIECAGIGQIAYFNATLMGAAGENDQTADTPYEPVKGTFFDDALPDVNPPHTFVSAGIEAHGNTLCVDGFSFNFGNEANRKTCVPPVGRIRGQRSPTISIAADALLDSDNPELPITEQYIKTTLFGFHAAVGLSKRMAIVAPKCQYTAIPHADRNGDLIYNAELQLNGDDDDEYLIAFFHTVDPS